MWKSFCGQIGAFERMTARSAIGEGEGLVVEHPPTPANLVPSARPSPGNDCDIMTKSNAPTGFSYLRPLRTSGDRPPLICFFPGYPGARDLAAALPDNQPVYEVWWPNMDNEVQYPTIEQLADLFIPEVQKLQPHGPYQFCGYSTFGLVAYEMGRRLLAKGQDVGFLALFDIWHPQFLDTLAGKEMARYKVLRVIDRLGKYRRILKGGGIRTVLSQLAEFTVNKSKSIAWRSTRAVYRIARRPVPKGMQIIASITANKSYVPPPYPKRFVLIRTEDFLDRKLSDHAVGWHACAPAGVDLYFIEGDHSTIKDEPFVRGLVEKIAPHLASASIRPIDSTG
jgi:thioesterase domain-containing protein